MTTEPKPWDHLPNAKRIDAVLASLKADPSSGDAVWSAARDAVWSAARDAARREAWDAARREARHEAWDAARDAAWDAARDAARDAVAALVAYDDIGWAIEVSPQIVEDIYTLGDTRLLLLLPAVQGMSRAGR